MSTLMKMENLKIIEDNHNLSNEIRLNENYLWCEPLTAQKDIDEVKRHLILSKIGYVVAKFDTTLQYNNEERFARVTGFFVRKNDLFNEE